MNPIVISVFWNEKMNGGKINNVVQCINDTKYYWNCYNCNSIYTDTILNFLGSMFKVKNGQFNKKCQNCSIVRGIDDSFVNNLVTDREELSFIHQEYCKDHRELEVITRCPLCGKLHSVKLRSIKRNLSFICKSCKEQYGGYKMDIGIPMSRLCPNIENYWGKDNKYGYYNTYPLVVRQQFSLICPRCGKSHTKSLEAIQRSSAYCEQCARVKNRLVTVGSLRDKYPEIADMWDRGNNGKLASEIAPSSRISGKFVCTNGKKPHTFIRPVSVIAESAKDGSNGCPICKNRELYTGVNDFATTFPDMVKYWDYTGNESTPDKTICTRLSKFSLVCPRCGKTHIKRADAIKRFGAYCEVCAHIISKLDNKNSLRDMYPDVADMWDKAGNAISSSELTPYSQTVGRFLCPGIVYKHQHTFIKSVQAVVNARSHKTKGCPICAGFKVLSGETDFKSKCPNGAKLWDYSKNTLKPEEVYYRSEKNFFFICPNGHSFEKDLLHMVRSENTSACGCPVCAGREVRKGVNDLATTIPDTVDRWCYDLNTITPYEVTAGSNKVIKARCRICGDVYETEVYNWCHNLVVACEKCRKRQFSIAEKELCEEIRSWGFHVEENKRLTGDARTYDMYIPEKNIAIEYNGLYYHSDAVRVNSNYHFEKCLDCLQNGIDLIQIWEDDYIFKKPIVLSFLKRKLGVSNEEKVNARDCEPMFIDVSDAREFLDLYHIQGFVSGSKYVGLCDKDSNIMAVIVLEKNKKDNSVLIKRYASCCNVRGGFSKLVASIKEVFEDCDSVYTFSDNTISFGDLYKNNGFESKQFLPPDYKYVVAGRRVHKFNYRKERFKSDPNLYYEEGLTEEELAEENGLIRVYDAGKIKWYKKL